MNTKKLTKKQIKERLIQSPLEEGDALYFKLNPMGFFDKESQCWIVNPFWSACGRFQVDPTQEYGEDFLSSAIGAYLGFRIPTILYPGPFLLGDVRKKHELSIANMVVSNHPDVIFTSKR